MSTGSKITLAIILVIGLVVGIFSISIIGWGISFNNACVSMEKTISAQYDQNKNNYDNYFKKIKEACQVPDMYTDSLKKVYDSVMQGRYGKEGSKAMFQWIQEQNPQVDSDLFIKIQQIIESGRNDFESNQKSLIEYKRVYEESLLKFPNSLLAGFLGFPKIDMDKLSIITSDVTEQAFETKRAAPLNLKE